MARVCPNCGLNLTQNFKCGNCGSKGLIDCVHCGCRTPFDWQCQHCGRPIKMIRCYGCGMTITMIQCYCGFSFPL